MNKNNPIFNPTSGLRLKFGKMLMAPKALPQLTYWLHPGLTRHPQANPVSFKYTSHPWTLLSTVHSITISIKKRLGNNLEKRPLIPLLLHPLCGDLSDILIWMT